MEALLCTSQALTNTAPINVLCHDAQPWRVASPKDQPLLTNLSAECLTPLTFLGEGAYGCVELCRVSVPLLVSSCNSKAELGQGQHQHENDTAPCSDSAYSVGGCGGTAGARGGVTGPASHDDLVVVRPGRFCVGRLRLYPGEPPPTSASTAHERSRSPFAHGRTQQAGPSDTSVSSSSCLLPARAASSPAAAIAGGAVAAAAGAGAAATAARAAAPWPSRALGCSQTPQTAPCSAASPTATPTAASTATIISNELVVAVKRLEYRGDGGRGRGADKEAGKNAGSADGATGCRKGRRNGPSRVRLGRMQAIELLQMSRCRECPFIVRVFGCVPDGPGTGPGAGQRKSAPSPSASSSSCRIVMEWAEGGDLGSLLQTLAARREPCTNPARERLLMSEASARFYMGCLLEALGFLHGRGLIHRDVKPANLLLSSDGRAKLGDLGMVCHLDKDGLAVGRAGTPNYMAPEVWAYGTLPKYAAGYGATADLWSAGVVLHELLTGHLPAVHPDMYLRRNWLFVPRCAAFSPDLCDLLSRLLSVKRRRRPQSCADVVAHPWFAGFDWQALRDGSMPAPYVPAAHRPQCGTAAAAAGVRPPPTSGHMSPVAEDAVVGGSAGDELTGSCGGSLTGGAPARPSGAGGGTRHTAPPAAPHFQPRIPSPVAPALPALEQAETPRAVCRGPLSWSEAHRMAASVEVAPAGAPAPSTASSIDGAAAVGRSAPAWTFGVRIFGRASSMNDASSRDASDGAHAASGGSSTWATGSPAATPSGAAAPNSGFMGSGLVSAAAALASSLMASSAGAARSAGFAGRASSCAGAAHVPSRLARSSDGLPCGAPSASGTRGGADAAVSVRASAPMPPGGRGGASAAFDLPRGGSNTGGAGKHWRPPRPPSQSRKSCAPAAPLSEQRTVSYSFLLSPPSAGAAEFSQPSKPPSEPADPSSCSVIAQAERAGGGAARALVANPVFDPERSKPATAQPPHPAQQLPMLSALMSLPRNALALGAMGLQSGSWVQQRLAGAASLALSVPGQLQAAVSAAAAAATAAITGGVGGQDAMPAPQSAIAEAPDTEALRNAAAMDRTTPCAVGGPPALFAEAGGHADTGEPATGFVLVRRADGCGGGPAAAAVAPKITPQNGRDAVPVLLGVSGLLPPRPARHSHRYSSSFAFDVHTASPGAAAQQGPPLRSPRPQPAAGGCGNSTSNFSFTVLPVATEEDGTPELLATRGAAGRGRYWKSKARTAGNAKGRSIPAAGLCSGAAGAPSAGQRTGGMLAHGVREGHGERPCDEDCDVAMRMGEAVVRLYAACMALMVAVLVAYRLAA